MVAAIVRCVFVCGGRGGAAENKKEEGVDGWRLARGDYLEPSGVPPLRYYLNLEGTSQQPPPPAVFVAAAKKHSPRPQ